jgi:DNA-binding MarR family transcriptional regulator
MVESESSSQDRVLAVTALANEAQTALDADSLDAYPGYQLWLAANSLQRAFHRRLAPLELTFVQFFVLGAVSRLAKDQAVSQAQVCRFCGMDPNMISQVARTLEGKGLLKRSVHPSDRRAHDLALTPAGEALHVVARERLRPLDAAYFAPLTGRRAEFAAMLRDLIVADEG